MRNPLIKRLPREFKSELGKYIVIFLFITIMIGFVSGFLVTINSAKTSYNESFDKYNIEDGNFELANQADDYLISELENENISIYENFYLDKETDNVDSTVRIFKNREYLNKVAILKGELAESADEIAIDRVYANNNNLKIGDSLIIDNKELEIVGFVALSDYNSLYQNPNDTMLEATKFGVAVMTTDGFDSFTNSNIHYSYSWEYNNEPKDDNEEKKMADAILEVLYSKAVLVNYLPQYANPSIIFLGNDMGKDEPIILTFLIIVMLILAFIFAITTSNTISKEANVIGTLMASGYTKFELIRHYLAMPSIVTLVSALIGNILGYTLFHNLVVDIYYTTYSVPAYEVEWSFKAFLITTIIPIIIVILLNLFILIKKLNISPLKFIRRDLSKKSKKNKLKLNIKASIMTRFRLRILLQNLPNYITIVIGTFFANIIVLLGIALPTLMDNYGKTIVDNAISDYQYILKVDVETKNEDAEKFYYTSLLTVDKFLKSEAATIYGIENNSNYVNIDFNSEEIYISSGYSEKFRLDIGDTFKLKMQYEEKEYSFKVAGVYDYPSIIAIFMSKDTLQKVFDESEYYSGYFTNFEITDIDERLIASKITLDVLTKTSRQLKVSMGNVMDMLFIFGLLMFMLIIYLLSKIIIEKNAQSISMTKILGYNNKEIAKLYILSTAIVVILSILITLPICDSLMVLLCRVMMMEFPGWLPYYVPFITYVEIVAASIVCYLIIVFLQFRKIKKVPLNMALKNIE